MEKIRVLIADNQELIGEGLVALLKEKDEINVLGAIRFEDHLIEQVENKDPDILLIYYIPSDRNLLILLSAIKEKYPSINFIILFPHYHEEILRQGLALGINGFLSKCVNSVDLLNAIHIVYTGNTYFSTEVANNLVKIISNKTDVNQANFVFSARELEVLKLICEGKSTKKIADILSLSFHTIVSHRRNILQKANAHNTAGVINYASRHGLLEE